MGYIPSLYSATQAVFGLGAFTVCTAATLLYRYQRNLVYPSNFPSGSRSEVITPVEYDIEYENVTLKTPDEESLHCFLMMQEKISEKERSRGEEEGREETIKRRPTVIVFHANAGNMGHRIPLAAVFYKRFGCNVFMLSYRGYGLSTGEASEVGIRIDAQTALDYIKQHPVLKDTLIILYGQSIGGAVAIDVASRNPKTVRTRIRRESYGTDSQLDPPVVQVHALILENTFLSVCRPFGSPLAVPSTQLTVPLPLAFPFTQIPALIPHVLPLVRPFAFLCREYWDSEQSIKKIASKTPILFLTGRQDELVPPSHMDTLMSNCTSEVKIRMVLAEGNHNDTCVQPGYFDSIGLFLATYVVPQTSGGHAAAKAAHSVLSGKYKFADNPDSDGMLDIVATHKGKEGTRLAYEDFSFEADPHTRSEQHAGQQEQSKITEIDESESEWVQMTSRDVQGTDDDHGAAADKAPTVSVAPQDAI